LWKFISRLNQEGHTIVLTTHYLEEAQELCGRIAMLKKGQIVALDTTANLLARVNNAQSKDGDLEDVFMQVMSEGH
jgi:ABC-2 type transport system ATP-binding protein